MGKRAEGYEQRNLVARSSSRDQYRGSAAPYAPRGYDRARIRGSGSRTPPNEDDSHLPRAAPGTDRYVPLRRGPAVGYPIAVRARSEHSSERGRVAPSDNYIPGGPRETSRGRVGDSYVPGGPRETPYYQPILIAKSLVMQNHTPQNVFRSHHMIVLKLAETISPRLTVMAHVNISDPAKSLVINTRRLHTLIIHHCLILVVYLVILHVAVVRALMWKRVIIMVWMVNTYRRSLQHMLQRVIIAVTVAQNQIISNLLQPMITIALNSLCKKNTQDHL